MKTRSHHNEKSSRLRFATLEPTFTQTMDKTVKNFRMKKTQVLANRLREVVLNGSLIANTNFKDQLEYSDWKIATSKVDPLNTISLLSQHVHYYINGVRNVFKGGDLEIRDTYSFDFPPMESQEQWETFLTKFWDDTENLAQLIERIPEEQLSESFADEKYGSYERNIDGIIEHCYYHLGQIVLLKKFLLKNR